MPRDPLPLDEEEIRRRLPVWIAFSDLYLDNETQPHEYMYIARVSRESGYTPEQLRRILFHEVGPVFCHNLLQVAGEWTGFHEGDVERLMRRQLESPRPFPWLFRKMLTEYTAKRWAVLQACLSDPGHASQP